MASAITAAKSRTSMSRITGSFARWPVRILHALSGLAFVALALVALDPGPASSTPLYTLTTTTVGNGRVRKLPDNEAYPEGSHVTLTATTSSGWHLVGWSGDASGAQNPLDVTMDRDKSITATFAVNTYTLTVVVSGSGTVARNPSQPTYDYATVVQLTATPAAGWSFVGWTGDASGSANPTNVIMAANRSVTALFQMNPHTLTVTTVGSGTVTRTPDLPTYDQGTVVQLTATPATGWQFVGWSGDATGSDSSISVTMNGDRAITATFAIGPHALTLATVGSGSVTRNPDQPQYDHGSVVQLTAVPATGWHFVGWSGDVTGSTSPLNVTMDANKSITATFAINTYTLTVSISGGGTVTVSPNQPTYTYGTVVQLTANPATNFHLTSWIGDASGTTNPLSITMDGNKSIVATFKSNDSPFELPDGFTHQLVISGLDEPVGIAFLPDGRLLVVERASARIRLVVEGTLGYMDPMCVVDSVTSVEGERGLLGIAVDPQWPQRPFVYVYYTALGGTIRLSRFEVGGNLIDGSSGILWIDPASRYDVLRGIPDMYEYHNAGTLRFGTDGMLYVSIGDDGQACTAQDSTALRGVLLRIDVSHLPTGNGGPPSRASLVPPDNPWASSPNVDKRMVWAMGFRNPFRFHIDPVNGAAFVADVGFETYEEVDQVTRGSGVQNYGWPYFEGPMVFNAYCPTLPPPGLAQPIHSYLRTGWTAAVIGAGVYRGHGCQTCDFPSDYEGDYFFSDFYQGFMRRLKSSGGVWSIAPWVRGQPSATDWGRGFNYICDYLPGADGALWYCRMTDAYQPVTGEIGRILFDRSILAVEGSAASPVVFAPPYPSPARDFVHFVYMLPEAAAVELSVFDVTGRQVRQLVAPSQQSAGRHHLAWDGHARSGAFVPPGIYLARLRVDGRPLMRRVVFAR
jgi:uncharacterized repeat protein (TIGR02543 family)